jgi:DNA repair ATPase RecN
MFKELIIKNLQCHKELTVTFTKGLNVIIGNTDSGKSAIIRALYLILMNAPRSGESIFKRTNSKDALVITLTDFNNNHIIRTKRKYYINDKLIKAFGSDIPKPIQELFPLKPLNWQKQLDQHFLILQTGGNAAKILNTSTGMEEQEELIKEIKVNISEHKSSIKRLIQNNQEHQDTIDKLKPITRLYLNAQAIKNIEVKVEQCNLMKSSLDKIITNIHIAYDNAKIQSKLIDLIAYVNLIQNLQNEVEISNQSISKLSKLIDNIEAVQKLIDNSVIYNKLFHSINRIQSNQNDVNKLNKLIISLRTLTDNMKESYTTFNEAYIEVERFQNEFNKNLRELGECPLCGTKFKRRKDKC